MSSTGRTPEHGAQACNLPEAGVAAEAEAADTAAAVVVAAEEAAAA
jgi:hypothetical protein